MFNIQGSELIFLLLVALVVLGPEKLPDAIRKAGRAYSEFKKMANGFQGELTKALDEPMRELRDTADAMRAAANFDFGSDPTPPPPAAAPAAPVRREQGLNFGTANPRRTDTSTDAASPAGATAEAAAATTTPAPSSAPQGLNFGSANPRRQQREQDAAEAAAEAAAAAPPVEKVPNQVPRIRTTTPAAPAPEAVSEAEPDISAAAKDDE